jgi:hypothetical protein
MIHMHQLTKLADDRAQITHSRAAWTACEGISAAEQIGGYLKSSVDNAWWAGISAA